MLVENLTQRARDMAIWISPQLFFPRHKKLSYSPRSFSNCLPSTKATITSGPAVNGGSHLMTERSCSTVQLSECFLTRSFSVQGLFRLAFVFFPIIKPKTSAYHLPFLLDYSCYLFPWGDAETPQTQHRCPNRSDQDTKKSVPSQTVYKLTSHLHWKFTFPLHYLRKWKAWQFSKLLDRAQSMEFQNLPLFQHLSHNKNDK